jgi:hypothetical protein
MAAWLWTGLRAGTCALEPHRCRSVVRRAATTEELRCTTPPTPAARTRVRLVLERSADIEARDTPAADWIATVRTLLEHGESTDDVTFSSDGPKPPSAEVGAPLRDQIDAEPT